MAKTENKAYQKENLTEVLTLWKRQSKSDKPYFTGKDADGNRIVGFFNTNKKNPKEPDLRVYRYDGDEIAKDPFISLWCNVSKNGKKYLSTKIDGVSYVGFISGDSEESKRPYVRVYKREDQKPNTNKPNVADNSTAPF